LAETRISWPASRTAELQAYTERLQSESIAAAEKATQFLHERVVARAKSVPEWSGLADNIEVWSQDGQLVIGFNDEDFASQAFAIEYGDEVRPPSPLFRTMGPDIRAAEDVIAKHMESKFGYEGRFRAAAGPESGT